MSDPLPGLIVLAIGGSVAPPLLLLTILFLGSRRPLPNACALALGYFATCAVIGVSGLVVLGLRSLLGSSDPDASPPGWMESINSISPPKAFGIGMALFPLQIKNLAIFVACLNLIIASNLGPEGSIAALGLVLVVFAIPVLALLGLSATVPGR